MTLDLTKTPIAANIEALRQVLADAVITTSEGFQAIQQGEQNAARGMRCEERIEQRIRIGSGQSRTN